MTEEKHSHILMPMLLALAVAIGSVVLWQALISQESTAMERMTTLQAAAIKQRVESELKGRFQALNRMGRRWEMRGQPPRLEWEDDASLYIKHYGSYYAIEWRDTTFQARWIVKQKGVVDNRDLDARSEKRRHDTLVAAKEQRSTIASQTIRLAPDNEVFEVAIPLFPNNEFGGFLVGIFRSGELLDIILRKELSDSGYAVAISDGDEIIYESDKNTKQSLKTRASKTTIELPGLSWQLQVWPESEYLTTLNSSLPHVTLAMGLIMAFIFGLTIYFAQSARRREQQLQTLNQNLQNEIAERIRAQEAEHRHAIELERSNNELQQFAYVASHDLQEPLRIVAGYLQLLARRYSGKLDKDADEFINYAVDGAVRMQMLINDLLAYSRVGSKDKVFEEIDCEKILDAVLYNLQTMIDENDAIVTHDPLPTIKGDVSQITQLFTNLIGNAIKYRSDSAPQIHISATVNAQDWQFSVRDNGIGLDPKHADRIFVIFQRLHSKGEYSGTGIGLAICKKVVENHGGRIWVESQPGKGSTFYFKIPAIAGQ